MKKGFPPYTRVSRRSSRPISVAIASGSLCMLCAMLPSCYATGVASQYLKILSKARPVEDVLGDPSTDAGTRAFLERCADIRSFAIDELGLKASKNYTTYDDPGRDYVADVVQACAELSFDRYLWSYPIVGKLPYKGFFSRDEADAEASRLRGRGYDVIVRQVSAFSTLGFLKDPLWSFMASYSDAELADLIIHELCHATVFKRGQDDFNEELASFVGSKGALLYIRARKGPGSAEELERARLEAAAAEFRSFLAGTADLLQNVYGSDAEDAQKRAEKARIISERALLWKERTDKADPLGSYARFDMTRINNAYLDLYRLYYGEEGLYADACDRLYGGDLPSFIQGIVAIAKRVKDPKLALRKALENS